MQQGAHLAQQIGAERVRFDQERALLEERLGDQEIRSEEELIQQRARLVQELDDERGCFNEELFQQRADLDRAWTERHTELLRSVENQKLDLSAARAKWA